MPVYRFNCPTHGEFDDLADVGQEKALCPDCQGVCPKQFSTEVAFVVPPWMRAEGSVGSSALASARQGDYLASAQHRQDMAQWERQSAKRADKEQRMNDDLTNRLNAAESAAKMARAQGASEEKVVEIGVKAAREVAKAVQ